MLLLCDKIGMHMVCIDMENSIARMLHLVQNSMSCNHAATILNAYNIFNHTYIRYVPAALYVLSPSARGSMHLN